MIYAVLIVAAVALGLAAFALYVAIVARGRAIDAQQRTVRHQQEHRLGAEDTGIRRHRAVEQPSTEQIAAQRPGVPSGATAAPATALAAATPPDTGPYARLRQSAADAELSATAAHVAPRRPGSAPNFTAPPPAGPSLPPPGAIDRDR